MNKKCSPSSNEITLDDLISAKPYIDTISQYNIFALSKFSMPKPLCICYQVFGFTFTTDNQTIKYKNNLGSTISYENVLQYQRMVLDLLNAQIWATIDPLFIINNHISKMEHNEQLFWTALNHKITDTIYEPITKYLILKHYIVTTYFVADIGMLIMMKYYDLEYIRVKKIMSSKKD